MPRRPVVANKNTRPSRDNFPASVIRLVAGEVGHICSNPGCGAPTSGPSKSRGLSNVGTAAHITAAAPKGPRYAKYLSPEKRKSAENAIWLCGRCARLIDNDTSTYKDNELYDWKIQAVSRARRAIETGKPIASGPSEETRLHDVSLFRSADLLMTEQQLRNFEYRLTSNDMYADLDFERVAGWLAFFQLEGNQFLIPSIRERCVDLRIALGQLLRFISNKFFVYPRSSDPPTYALQPALNFDREGSGKPDETRRYEELQTELYGHAQDSLEKYIVYRRTIKQQLII